MHSRKSKKKCSRGLVKVKSYKSSSGKQVKSYCRSKTSRKISRKTSRKISRKTSRKRSPMRRKSKLKVKMMGFDGLTYRTRS
jgi:hypothetical protein